MMQATDYPSTETSPMPRETRRVLRLAFIMEQTLGHITHSQNLRRYLAGVSENAIGAATDLMETPGPPNALNKNKAVRRNLMLQVAVDGYVALRNASKTHDGALIHTSLATLFCGPIMARFPTVLSMDATPLQAIKLYNPDLSVPEDIPRLQRLKANFFKKTDIKGRILRQSFKKARRIVTWSEWAKQSAVHDYGVSPEKVEVIPPGIDLSVFCPSASVHPNDGVVRILFVGGDFARKGGNILLQWARERQKSETPWELHLVTPYKIAEQTSPNVFVHSSVTNNSPELVRLYQRSDVFALPTQADCTPLVGLEAQACGLPVVTTTVGGLPDVVAGGETGFLVAPNDAVAFGERLDTLMNDAALRNRMGQSARARALKHFDLNTNYARLVQITREASGKN